MARGFSETSHRPVRLRSSRKIIQFGVVVTDSRAATQPNGAVRRFAKSPRHNKQISSNQSSRALTDLGDNRKLRRLRLTLLRWFTRLGPLAIATPIANTSITTRWAMRDVSGV